MYGIRLAGAEPADIRGIATTPTGTERCGTSSLPDHLLPGIVVLNERYFPENELAAARVGATSFARSVLRCLRRAELFAGMILYRRDETSDEPVLETVHRAGITCIVLRFHFGMSERVVRAAIAEAADRLLASYGWDGHGVLCYQTDVLLRFHPDELIGCVTHHGPFVHDVVGTFSAQETGRAFGGATKALHLLEQQERGLARVRENANMYVLQHSFLQRSYLIDRGVDARRIFALRPPISVPAAPAPMRSAELAAFVADAGLLLCTAVARLDHFKNVELLIDAGIRLCAKGIPIRMLVAGGGDNEQSMRAELANRVPREYAEHFMAVPKLAKPELYSLFRQARRNGIFVCPSRYETLGITPLEAALSGVCTLIAESEKVEAARFFPSTYRFDPTVDGLAKAIERIYRNPRPAEAIGAELRRAVGAEVSEENFRRDLLRAWGQFALDTRGSDE
ncbi:MULTISPECIES: glycosyltransferase family 4 protein [unclassified Nocardia]|uniref:glycosyltransferase family 4 protein n=1 Tax=unclassified Nocardia TaxID=2637762 RepID=UPI001CE3DA69|nr:MULTISPECIES: glycosyltransferase family 4 protein [unclassified Nocardia]